jgi:hypothetical protein
MGIREFQAPTDVCQEPSSSCFIKGQNKAPLISQPNKKREQLSQFALDDFQQITPSQPFPGRVLPWRPGAIISHGPFRPRQGI